MKIEIIGTGMGPILSSKKLDELFFGTSTINKKSPLEEAMDKLLDEARRGDVKTVVLDSLGDVMEKIEKDAIGKYNGASICFDIQSITANHKKNAFTVVWGDGSHTIIHLQKGDVWDDEKALAMCFVKHMMGDTNSFNDIFTTEMPAKIKRIGKVEPVEEKHERHCATPCEKCTCGETMATGGCTGGFSIEKDPVEKTKEAIKKAGASAERVDKAVDTLAEMVDNFLRGGTEKASTKKYKVFSKSGYTMTPAGEYETAKLAKARITELAKELWGSKPYYYRVWTEDDKLVIDFGSYIKFIVVEGMTMDEWAKN